MSSRLQLSAMDTDSDFEDQPQRNRNQRRNEVGWSFKRPVMQGLKYQINVYCKETVLQNIRSVLKAKSRTGYKEFQNSCFGVFSKLPKVVGKCNSAVYYVLTHEIVFNNGGDDTEMCFLINDKIVRFRRFEYALITGLKFGKSSFDPNGNHNIPEGSLHTRMFRNAKVKVEDLFNEFEGKRLGDIAEDYLKAAKILFVYYVLLGMDPKKTNVAHWMWVLVEDNDRWEKFPWGSYSYQHLIRYLKKIRKKPSKTTKKHVIHMYGFTTAFMAWIYCAMPQLGKTCGEIASLTNTPRLLRFKYTRSNMEISGVEGEILETLDPSAEEVKTKYWKSVELQGTPFKLDYKRVKIATHDTEEEAHLLEDHTKARTSSQHHSGHDGVSGPVFGFTSSQQQSWIDDICMSVYSRIKNDKDLLDEFGKGACNLRNDRSFIEEIGAFAATSIKSEMSSFLPGYLEYMAYHQNCTSEQFQTTHDVNYTTPTHAMHHEECQEEDEILIEATSAAEAQYKELQLSKLGSKENEQIQSSIPPKLDFTMVRKRAPSAALCSPFRLYEKRGTYYKCFLRTNAKRNVGLGYLVPASFFKQIADHTKELEHDHIDAYLACLHTSPHLAGIRSYDRRIAITSTDFVPAVLSVWKKYHSEEELSPLDPEVAENLSLEDLSKLSEFIIGEQPKWGEMKSWYDFDKVAIVVRLPLQWATCCINLIQSHIMVYDSKQHTFEEIDYEDSRQIFVPLTRILPQVLRYSGFYDARKDVKPCLTQWNVLHPSKGNHYMQDDTKSCGAYALKYVEAILKGKMETGFDDKEAKKYRTNVAMTIYGFSTDEDTLEK